MRTGHLPTIHVLVATTRCQYWLEEVGPQVNKFEQVSSDEHQMSSAGEMGVVPRSDVLGEGVSAQVWCPGEGVPYLSHVIYLAPLRGQTDTCENLTFP